MSHKKRLPSIHTTIEGAWYFGRAVVTQRLINQALYHEILLLPKFNNI